MKLVDQFTIESSSGEYTCYSDDGVIIHVDPFDNSKEAKEGARFLLHKKLSFILKKYRRDVMFTYLGEVPHPHPCSYDGFYMTKNPLVKKLIENFDLKIVI